MKNRWRCLVCGYIHEGDGPPAVCPVCGAGAEMFEALPLEQQEQKDDQVTMENKAGIVKPAGLEFENMDANKLIHQALFRISYGLYIITVNGKGRDNGQCANTCFQITSDPPRIAIGINKDNYTHELIEASGKFGVSILHCLGQEYARRFGYRSGRSVDKFEGLKVHRGSSGVLLLDDVLATLEVSVSGKLDAGTHTLYLGDVTKAEILQEGDPMTYAYFRATK